MKYIDQFTVLKHPSGKVKLVGDKYSIFKSDNTNWTWCCTLRTSSSKATIIQKSENDGYSVSTPIIMTEFDFNNQPNL